MRVTTKNDDLVGLMIRVPRELRDRLNEEAAARDISAAWLARVAISRYLDRLIPVDELRLTRDS
jgi:predicted transcriptional regulator